MQWWQLLITAVLTLLVAWLGSFWQSRNSMALLSGWRVHELSIRLIDDKKVAYATLNRLVPDMSEWRAKNEEVSRRLGELEAQPSSRINPDDLAQLEDESIKAQAMVEDITTRTVDALFTVQLFAPGEMDILAAELARACNRNEDRQMIIDLWNALRERMREDLGIESGADSRATSHR